MAKPRAQRPDVREDTGLQEQVRPDEPPLYRVILHNDDYTTMDFVIEVIMAVFHRPAAEATRIMFDVHRKGQGAVGTYTRDIALTKVAEVHAMARDHSFPLRASCEEA